MALAKLGSSSVVGQFSLGLAIAAPVLMFTNLNLRAVQATDAQRTYSFGEYLRLRVAMTLAGLGVIAGIVLLGNYERQTAMVILTVALAKGIESVSDVHYGLFQLNDRLDQSGKSMIIRGILSVAALSVGMYVTHNLLWGCVGMALVWLAALILFDARQARRFVAGPQESGYPAGVTSLWRRVQRLARSWNLTRTALPLGIATTMAALNLNMPRYFIHARLGDRELGIYSAMAYATVPMILVSDSLGHSVVPRLARFYAGAHLVEYRALLLKMLAIGACLGIAGLAGAQLLGARLLGLFFRKRIRRSFGHVPGADLGCGDLLRSVYVHQRDHVRAAFHDPAADIHSGSRIERAGLRDLGAGCGAHWRRLGYGCGGHGASCTGRRGGGLLALCPGQTPSPPTGSAGMREWVGRAAYDAQGVSAAALSRPEWRRRDCGAANARSKNSVSQRSSLC